VRPASAIHGFELSKAQRNKDQRRRVTVFVAQCRRLPPFEEVFHEIMRLSGDEKDVDRRRSRSGYLANLSITTHVTTNMFGDIVTDRRPCYREERAWR
jgi:hypothetical protein